MAPCECPNENFVCHPADGCICRHGFTGEKCELQLSAKNVLEKEEKHYGSVAAGLVVALILVAIIVGLLFYYRRRVANLKTEIAHVQYIADPQSAPDRHHFDNPVYSYQTPVRSDDGANLLLNNVQKIRNDLGMKNNTNLERQKLGVPVGCEDDDNLSTKG
ncbi:unnamed protein product, partial [Timema podura]|nr:unnamed protein product [Timema podura]